MRALLLSGVIFLTACANNNPYGDGAANGVIADLPDTAIFYAQPSESLRDECLEFKDQSLLHYCKGNAFTLNELADALEASGRFRDLSPRNFNPDYRILITSAAFQIDDANSMTNAIVSGASLMLVPMKVETTLKAEFTIMWRGHVVDHFSDEIPVDFKFSLFTSQEAYDQKVAKAMADVLLKGIDERGSLDAEYLVEALDASDYAAELKIPENVAEFRLTEANISRDPFLGSMVRFNHEQFAFDQIDVFVYPIRDTDWSDASEVIGGEMENVRAELKFVEEQGDINSVDLGEADLLHWKTDSENTIVGFMDGYYATDRSGRVYTSCYVFLKGDKFVKVRASFPQSEEDASLSAPDEFVRALIPAITVPEESRFMARIRESHREDSKSN